MNAPSLQISDEQGQAFWRAAEAAQGVNDRYQLFVWMRLHLHRFVPHDLAMFAFRGSEGADPEPAQLFYSVPLPRLLLDELPRTRSRFWRDLGDRWLAQGGTALVVPLDPQDRTPEVVALRGEGFSSLAVHGLGAIGGATPEALFAFALRDPEPDSPHADPAQAAACLGPWMPTLYCTTLRALAPARPEGAASRTTGLPAEPALVDRAGGGAPLTGRELQILSAVREAKRNAQIGEQLGISPLTVKNHLRKIMRKLNAGNRAQAVAEAMARRLIA